MLYLDTNVIAAYYCPEAMSCRVESFLLSQTERLAVSHLTEVELASAISRKIREKNMTQEAGKRVVQQFVMHIREGYFERLTLNTTHYKIAKEWLARFDMPLRTLDALHLALSEKENAPIVTFDKQLLASASSLKVAYSEIRDL
jgi:predicted nucleic acid-binding protein